MAFHTQCLAGQLPQRCLMNKVSVALVKRALTALYFVAINVHDRLAGLVQLAAFDIKLLALRVESEALGQGKFDGFLYPVHFANRHRAQRFQPVDDLLDQYFRSRRAGCQAHAAFAVKPDFLQLAGVIDHVSLGASLAANSRSRLLFELVGLPTTIKISTCGLSSLTASCRF